MVDAEWLIVGSNGRLHGPYSTAQMRTFAQVNRITKDTTVIPRGTSKRVRAGDVTGIFAPVKATTPDPATTQGQPQAPAAGPSPMDPHGTGPKAAVAPPTGPGHALPEQKSLAKPKEATANSGTYEDSDFGSRLFRGVRTLITTRGFDMTSRIIWGAALFGIAASATTSEIRLIAKMVQSARAGTPNPTSAWWFVIALPVVFTLLTYMAHKCCLQCERLVRNTPTHVTGFVVFEMTGLALLALGLATVSLIVYVAIEGAFNLPGIQPEQWITALAALACYGGAFILAGVACLCPAIINVRQHEGTSVGQEGLALLGAPLKGLLATARISTSLGVAFATVMTVMATMKWIRGKSSPMNDDFIESTFAVIGALVQPVILYIVSIVYYIVIDVLDAILKFGKHAGTPVPVTRKAPKPESN